MDFLLRGGPFIWPILLESILALWVIVDRLLFVLTVLPRKRNALADIAAAEGNPHEEALAELGEFGEAVENARKQGPLNVSLLSLQADLLVQDACSHILLAEDAELDAEP